MVLSWIFFNRLSRHSVGDVVILSIAVTFPRSFFLVPNLGWINLKAEVSFIFSIVRRYKIELLTTWLPDEHASHYVIAVPVLFIVCIHLFICCYYYYFINLKKKFFFLILFASKQSLNLLLREIKV